MGMVRFMLWESCAEDWAYLEQVANSLLNQYSYEKLQNSISWQLHGDDMLAEALMLKYWLQSCLSYSQWHIRASYSYSARDLLDPPAVVFRPFLYQNLWNGVMIEFEVNPLPLEALEVHHNITVVTTRLWFKSNQWLGGIVTTGGLPRF